MTLFAGIRLEPFLAAPAIDTPDDAFAEAFALGALAASYDAEADERDPARTIGAVTDPVDLMRLPDDDPSKLRGSAELLRASARRMLDLVPMWREALEQLGAERADRP